MHIRGDGYNQSVGGQYTTDEYNHGGAVVKKKYADIMHSVNGVVPLLKMGCTLVILPKRWQTAITLP